MICPTSMQNTKSIIWMSLDLEKYVVVFRSTQSLIEKINKYNNYLLVHQDQVSPFVRSSGPGASSALAPIKSKTMPERLRLSNTYKPTPMDIKPPSPSTETPLAPLKVAKVKQSPVPLNVKSQHSGSSSPREIATPESTDNGKQWARKVKVKSDPLSLSPVRFVTMGTVFIRFWEMNHLLLP